MKSGNPITLARTAAQASGHKLETIKQAIETGELPALKIGRRTLVEDAPFANWLASGPIKPTETPSRAV